MYTEDTLDNGIRVVGEYIPYLNSVSIGVWVASGSRNESADNNGISHFIEHMMFKGTRKRSAKRIAEDIEEVGGQINAFTGKEATCFYAKVLSTHLDIAVDVLSDMLLNSRFDSEDMEKEKGVIQEEINMYEDSPEDLVSDLLSKAVWPMSSVGYPVLGSCANVKKFDRGDIMEYMKKYYIAQNVVISVAGKFEKDELMKMLRAGFGCWKGGAGNAAYDIPRVSDRNVLTKSKDIEQVHLSLGLNGIEEGNEDLYALSIVNNIFGGSTSSLLFQDIREQKGLAYSIYSYPSSFKNIGILSIYVGLNPIYLDQVTELITDEIGNIRRDGISEGQLQRSKEQLKGSYIIGLESTSNRMFGLGKSELLLNRIFDTDEVMSRIDSITMDDISRIIDGVFGQGIISGAVVGKFDRETNMERLLF